MSWKETKAGDLVPGARMLTGNVLIHTVTGVERKGHQVRVSHDRGAGCAVVLHEAERVWACLPETAP